MYRHTPSIVYNMCKQTNAFVKKFFKED